MQIKRDNNNNHIFSTREEKPVEATLMMKSLFQAFLLYTDSFKFNSVVYLFYEVKFIK